MVGGGRRPSPRGATVHRLWHHAPSPGAGVPALSELGIGMVRAGGDGDGVHLHGRTPGLHPVTGRQTPLCRDRGGARRRGRGLASCRTWSRWNPRRSPWAWPSRWCGRTWDRSSPSHAFAPPLVKGDTRDGRRRGRRAVIAGVATSDYPHLPHLSEHAVHDQAADRALADAGLTFADVDGFATTGFFPMYATGVAEYLGLHPIYFDETNSGGSSFEVLVEHAAYAVEVWSGRRGARHLRQRPAVADGSTTGHRGRWRRRVRPGAGHLRRPVGQHLGGQLRHGGPPPHARIRHHPRTARRGGGVDAPAMRRPIPRRKSASRSPSTTSCRHGSWPTPCTSSTAA